MTKLLVISDDGISSGYGRISMEVNTRLVKRGLNVMAASLYYDGLLPPNLDGQALPYWVGSLVGKDWVQAAISLINAYQPDIVHVVQDAPYAEAIRNAPVDWSRYAFMVTTPVDGAPIHPNWVNMLKGAQGVLSISQFGVETHKASGIQSELCRPGVDANIFFQLPDDQQITLRARVGIASDAFVVGCMAQNQGRKDIPDMLRAFFAFASDKPTSRLVLDMDAVSPAGWDIGAVCQQQGWDASKLLFRADIQRAGVVTLRERYNLLDCHMVISHREGYGLPLVEAQACGVVSIALDWCSGTEICGDGKGILIAPIEYDSIGTWGGAVDKYPNTPQLTAELQKLYDNPDEKRAIAKRGMNWARQQSWDLAADSVVKVIERVMSKRVQPTTTPPTIAPPAPIVNTVDGVQKEVVELTEAVG